ncbi:MAG: hypothetical protein KKF57_12885 [Firmicutes bacterium]|nr:hypothetical protein [Bacillota bacterium]
MKQVLAFNIGAGKYMISSTPILLCLECRRVINICSCIATLTSAQRIRPNYFWSYSFLREQRELKTLQRAKGVKRLKPCPRKASAETESKLIASCYPYYYEK